MEGILNRGLPKGDSFLEEIFKKIVRPWFEADVHKAKDMKRVDVFNRYSKEMDLFRKLWHRKQDKKGAITGGSAASSHKEQQSGVPSGRDIEAKKYKQTIDKQQEEITKLKAKINQLQTAGHSNGQPSKGSDRQVDELVRQCEAKQDKIWRLKEEISNHRLELEDNRDQIRRLQEALANSRDEADSLATRLSKLAGDKLRDGNPDITDLSDPNRPTNIGTHYSELYDNEWSDAFEELTKFSDDSKVRALFLIMQNAFSFCETINKNQLETIRGVLEGADHFKKKLGQPDEIPHKSKMMKNLHNMLKDIRKAFSSTAASNIALIYSKEDLVEFCKTIDIKKPGPKLLLYGQRCAELSWLMLACDPPMALHQIKAGDDFNSDLYKDYTRSAKGMKHVIVEMAVWPTLLLHDGGSAVTRGVAQPCDKTAVNPGK